MRCSIRPRIKFYGEPGRSSQDPVHDVLMRTIAITGATGFIGRHLLASLAGRPDMTVHALAHQTPDHKLMRSERVRWFRGNLADPATFLTMIVPGATLINLAYPQHWSIPQHLESSVALAEAAAERGVSRVIHLSTAVVVGRTPSAFVTEDTPAHPKSSYGRTKLALEQLWRTRWAGKFDVAILRPSAVFGTHGKNLLKLAHALTAGNRFSNYLRSCLYGRRKMNLVSVRNVVAAIELLIERRSAINGQIFIASEDDDPINNFRDVEVLLMNALGVARYSVPHVPIPPGVLRLLLRMLDSGKPDPFRAYDNSLLRRSGWIRRYTLADELSAFAAWYASGVKENASNF